MLESVKRLREWISSLYTPNSAELKSEGFAIADRIDEEAKDNEKFRDEAEPFCDRLRKASSERADVTLFGVDYSALPVDADGVPIHLGDVIQFVNEHGGTGAKVEVCAISEHYAYYGEGKHFYKASMCRHYHETVEDLLREFYEEVGDGLHTLKAVDTQVTIAKYASKLRLADDGEEQQ